jgi:hypothetical protein
MHAWLVAVGIILSTTAQAAGEELQVIQSPPTEPGIYLSYSVPAGAPDEVTVTCEWRSSDSAEWQPAPVAALRSETAQALVSPEDWASGFRDGRVVERRAAGLRRTLVLHPYPAMGADSRLGTEVRVTVHGASGDSLAEHTSTVDAQGNAIYIEDWKSVLTKGEVLPAAEVAPGKWQWQTELGDDATFGNALYGESTNNIPLRPLSYGLDLKGPHAIYVCTKPAHGVRIRLSGDERSDDVGSRLEGEEVLWRVARMDHQHLIIQQPHRHTGYTPAQIDYVKLVPLTEEEFRAWEAQFNTATDKIVGAYFEPYSWAFNEDLLHTLQHREPLLPYAETRMSLVDIQVGRFGMKSVFETRLTDQLLYTTIGDPIGDVAQPTTDNVGRMQQYTNTLDAELRYCRELGLNAHANFGASNCYVGTPLQGDFSKQHPEWVRGSMLRLEVPEARAYAMSLYRESLALGAPGISIDFCRYPEAVDSAETATQVLREMRALANEFTAQREKPVTVLVRFPGTSVRLAEYFDYALWAREGLVDYLCPSNIQGRHLHIDMAPYLEAVKGTKATLLPCVDGLSWGVSWPGPLLQRVKQLYDQGVPGVYVYQADARLLGHPRDRRAMALLPSKSALDAWWQREEKVRPSRSKGVYITPPHEFGKYHGFERIRIWTEGLPVGPVESWLDGQLIFRQEAPPYLVGTEDYATDGIIPPGPHELRIRVQDGEGWYDQTFTVAGG